MRREVVQLNATRIDADLLARIDALCAKRKWPRSTLVREALAAYVADAEGEAYAGRSRWLGDPSIDEVSE